MRHKPNLMLIHSSGANMKRVGLLILFTLTMVFGVSAKENKPKPTKLDKKLAELAKMATTQWTATFNPRKVGEDELLAIYRMAL